MGIKKWILFLALALTGCKSCTPVNHRQSTVQDVKELTPDCQQDKCRLGYAYQDNSMIWWYLYWYAPYNGLGYNYYNSYNSSTYITSNGGTWSQSDSGPRTEDVVGEKGIAVQESSNGQPEIAAEANAEQATEQVVQEPTAEQDQQAVESFENEGGAVAPDPEPASVEDNGSSSYDSPSDNSSSGGDFGGGDGGGGGGGD